MSDIAFKDIMGNFYDRRKNNTRFTHKMHYYHSFSTRSFCYLLLLTERMQQFYFPFVQHSLLWRTWLLSCSSSILLETFLYLSLHWYELPRWYDRIWAPAFLLMRTFQPIQFPFIWFDFFPLCSTTFFFGNFVLWNGYGYAICRGISRKISFKPTSQQSVNRIMKCMVIEFMLFSCLSCIGIRFVTFNQTNENIVRSYHIGLISLIVGVHRCKQTIFNWHFFALIFWLTFYLDSIDKMMETHTVLCEWMWPIARDHSKSEAKQSKKRVVRQRGNILRELKARLVEFHTKCRRCSQLNQQRINLYWDKIVRTCTNDTILHTMCACAMCMHCQCNVRDFFFQKGKTKKRKIPVASSRFTFFVIFLSLILVFSLPFVHLSFIFLSWHIHDLMHMKRAEYYVHSYRAHKHFSILLGRVRSTFHIIYEIDACSICVYSSSTSTSTSPSLTDKIANNNLMYAPLIVEKMRTSLMRF